MNGIIKYMNGIINALSLWKSGGQNVDFTADISLPLMLSFDRQPLIIFRVLITLVVSLSPQDISSKEQRLVLLL
ncbi:MAG: hypothetical protein QOK69_04205 [Nitrososphaeraceae archaeon]|nr:hypothetical protein [Nitrososphaeraceae archaeon]